MVGGQPPCSCISQQANANLIRLDSESASTGQLVVAFGLYCSFCSVSKFCHSPSRGLTGSACINQDLSPFTVVLLALPLSVCALLLPACACRGC